FSLLFVGYELRLARSVAELETYSVGVELSRSQREFIANNSDVWAKGCMGEDLTPSETVEFTNIVLEIIGLEFYRWNRARVGIAFEAGELNGPQTIARNLYNFPGFLAVWEGGRISGSPNFRIPGHPSFKDDITEQYELLVESDIEKKPDVAWCGR
ncbi:MAG: hypothetical protein RLP02_16100, partial [Coleofasciculus sp. C2-GNP5-27]